MVNLTHTAIYAKIKAGKFPAGVKTGRMRFWDLAKVQEWQHKERVTAEKDEL